MIKIICIKFIKASVLVMSLLCCTVIFAQDSEEIPKKIYRITLKSGDVIYGELLSRSSEEIVITSEMYGQLTIPQKKIKELKRYHQRLNDEFAEETLITSSFNLLSPTAYTLKKGESYLANKYLFYNQVNYGITDNFQIGAGFEFLSMLFSNNPTFFVSLKGHKEIADHWKVSANAFYAYGNLLSNQTLTGSLVSTTYGTVKNNITLGTGMIYYDKKWQQKPGITLALVKQITDKISFISDNFYLPMFDNSLYYSYGFRVFGEEIALDLYFVNNNQISKIIPIGFPVVGATIQL